MAFERRWKRSCHPMLRASASWGQPKSFRTAAACRRLMVARDHEGRARQIAKGGSRIVKWETNLNLGLTHHSFGLEPEGAERRGRAAVAANPPVCCRLLCYDNVAGPRVSEATLREESRRRDPRLSPGSSLLCRSLLLLPSLLQRTALCSARSTLMDDSFRKSRKRRARRQVCIGRILDAMDRTLVRSKPSPNSYLSSHRKWQGESN
jgi:hypothetical protein